MTHLTETSWETWWTEAVKAINLVMATAAVEARLADALVQVFLTVITFKSRSAHALETIHQVLNETKKQKLSQSYFLWHKCI